MKALLILVLASVLQGCAPFKTVPETIIKYKYVVITAPEEHLKIPAQIAPLDTKTATDKDAGNWILDTERRSLELEAKLKRIKELQDRRLKELESLPKADVSIR